MSSESSGSRRGWRWLVGGTGGLLIVGLLGYGYLKSGADAATLSDSVDFSNVDGASLGHPDAPVVIAEFADFQCPACAWYAENELPRIRQSFVETGLVRLVFFDFPLRSHPHAFEAARAARCAGDQDRFWEYHDILYERQQEWGSAGDAAPAFREIAAGLHLDGPAFARCLQSSRFRDEVDLHVQLGRSLGVRGTPSLFVDGTLIEGIASFEEVQRLVEEGLARVEAER